MSEKSGETVRDGGAFRCERCHQVTQLERGTVVPLCPNCGFDTFDISNPRFERKDGSLGPHEPG